MCLEVSVLFHTLRSSRKIFERVLKSEKTFEVTVLAWKNFLPAGSFERGEFVQVQNVDSLVL